MLPGVWGDKGKGLVNSGSVTSVSSLESPPSHHSAPPSVRGSEVWGSKGWTPEMDTNPAESQPQLTGYTVLGSHLTSGCLDFLLCEEERMTVATLVRCCEEQMIYTYHLHKLTYGIVGQCLKHNAVCACSVA